MRTLQTNKDTISLNISLLYFNLLQDMYIVVRYAVRMYEYVIYTKSIRGVL